MRHGGRSRAGTSTFVAKPDLVSATLVYPVTETTDDASSWGLSILGNASSPLDQQLLQVQNAAGTVQLTNGVTGGPILVNADIRVAHAYGGAYAAFNGSAAVPCLELPDGAGQGSKVWSGTGAPSSTTVGTAAVGDYYWRRYNALPAPTIVAMSHSTSGATNTAITVGSGTPGTNITHDLAGAVQVGDLLVVVAVNTIAAETMTVGSDTVITDTSTNGGVVQDDGTRRIHMLSHVIQSGDIVSNIVTASALDNSTGSSRRLFAYVFRHEWGWPTTGSKHGCTLNASNGISAGAGTTTQTPVVTGPSTPHISICAVYGGTNTPSSPGFTFYWDAGTATDKTSDSPGGTNTGAAAISAKPGLGTNTSGATGYATGGSTLDVTNRNGATALLLGNWKVKTTPPVTPLLYVCSVAGAPGSSTWVTVI